MLTIVFYFPHFLYNIIIEHSLFCCTNFLLALTIHHALFRASISMPETVAEGRIIHAAMELFWSPLWIALSYKGKFECTFLCNRCCYGHPWLIPNACFLHLLPFFFCHPNLVILLLPSHLFHLILLCFRFFFAFVVSLDTKCLQRLLSSLI